MPSKPRTAEEEEAFILRAETASFLAAIEDHLPGLQISIMQDWKRQPQALKVFLVGLEKGPPV